MTRLAWFLVVIILGLIFGAFLMRRPWAEASRMRAKSFEIRKELEKVEREQAEVVKTRLRLETPLGLEVLAREQGKRQPKEIPLILP